MMELAKDRKGFAVMSPDLKGISIDSASLIDIKPYCKNGDVIVERIPVLCGFSLTIKFMKFWKPIYFRTYAMKNILWIHWIVCKEYRHKTGKIVYRST
jgi:hypothetical protein